MGSRRQHSGAFLAALTAGLLWSGTARAAPKASEGFQAAVRAGTAHPAGNIAGWYEAIFIGDSVRHQVPLSIVAGYKPIPYLFLGAYLTYAPGFAGDLYEKVCETSSCAFHTVRAGAEARISILPKSIVNPWLGYGLGYERTWWSVESDGELVDCSLDGFQYFHLLFGLDVRFHEILGVGPYLDLAQGTYLHRGVETPRYEWSDNIANPELHLWFTAGLQGVVFP